MLVIAQNGLGDKPIPPDYVPKFFQKYGAYVPRDAANIQTEIIDAYLGNIERVGLIKKSPEGYRVDGEVVDFIRNNFENLTLSSSDREALKGLIHHQLLYGSGVYS